MSETVRVSDVASPVRVPKTAELVASHLRRQIVRGELREGDALPPESALIEQFGVSRPTLREAFRVLESEALITVRRGARGGARVHTPDGDAAARYAGLVLQFRGATLADVYEARKALELAALGAVVAKHSKETLARLEQNIDAMAAAGEPTEIMRLHDEFHRLLLESARNRTLMIFEEMIHHIVELHGEYVVTHRSKLEVRAGAVAGSRAHHRLVELITAGNADAALDLWQRHLDEVSAIVLHDAATTTVLDLLG